MNQKHFAIASLFLAATHWTLFLAAPTVAAQTTEPVDWSAVRSRLQGIYEQGEWQARRFRGEWLPDSSGYLVPQRGNNHDQTLALDVETGEPISAPTTGGRDRRLSPDGKQKFELVGPNLFLHQIADNSRRRIIPRRWFQDTSIHDPSWSPNGTRILFTESDQTDVRERLVLIPSDPPDPSYPSIQRLRFARVGETIPTLRAGVFECATDETIWLPIESPAEGFYLGQVEWAGNDSEVLVETLSRFRDRREFYLVDVVEQKANKIYWEVNAAWAISSHDNNLGLHWIDQGQKFVVVSEKDGWRHAFLYSRAGQELAILTPGPYDIIDRATIDEARGYFYFYASPENATQKYLFRVPLDGSGTLTRVTPADQLGTHVYDFSPDGRYAFHTYSTFDTPPVTALVELANHRVIRVLEDNAELRRKAESSSANRTEFLQLDIGDGVVMDAWMLKPNDFDPAKKYPVFVYVYGEPHAQTVLDAWATVHDQFHRTIANLGYLVISIDNRGTPAPKGAAWRRSVFGSLGPLSTEDQSAALKEFARTRPYADMSRVGVWGWSGGGSNTLNALFRKPNDYHVGIAVVPKPQPHLYNAWFQEIYMRTPEVNPEGYETAAAINYAAGLQGKLLIITGSGETNTHIQIIEGLIDRLVEMGKPFDYMVYPNRDHGLREGPGTVVHVYERVIRYLVEHLPRGGVARSERSKADENPTCW